MFSNFRHVLQGWACWAPRPPSPEWWVSPSPWPLVVPTCPVGTGYGTYHFTHLVYSWLWGLLVALSVLWAVLVCLKAWLFCSCDHCAELLLWLGSVCRGLHAQQQPDDGGGLPHRGQRCHPLIHHVCRNEQVTVTDKLDRASGLVAFFQCLVRYATSNRDYSSC